MQHEAPLAVIVVNMTLYRLLAVQKTAHRYSGHYRIRLTNVEPGQIEVAFFPKPSASIFNRPSIADFETDLLDQELREAIGAETQAVRNLILAQAFSNVNLLDPIGEEADFERDPLNIRVPDKRP